VAPVLGFGKLWVVEWAQYGGKQFPCDEICFSKLRGGCEKRMRRNLLSSFMILCINNGSFQFKMVADDICEEMVENIFPMLLRQMAN
jgi:hypothetical protein